MSYIEKKGNIFNSRAMAIVNTVNCVGAMGKGIALDFKLRYPAMFKEYQRICYSKMLHPGQILPYTKASTIILNFAIKDDWKDPSRIEWIEETLAKFVDNYKRMGITSIAFPWMGAMNGGLPLEDIKRIMRQYLSSLDDIEVEVYEFDPNEPCALFNTLIELVGSNSYSIEELQELSGIKARYWMKIIDAVKDPQIKSINNLCHYTVDNKRIIGKTNIERLFYFLTEVMDGSIVINKHLFVDSSVTE